MANRPRWIKAGCVYSEVQRSVDRSFLFKPNEQIRQLIGSSAGRAQEKFPVLIYWLEFNINHKHTSIAPLSKDPQHIHNVTEFHKLFNSLGAKGINKIIGREGAVYSTNNRSVECIDESSMEQQLFYAVTNVVKDGLVDRVADWKGFSSYKQLATGEEEKFHYIDYAAWKEAGGAQSGKKPEAFLKTTSVKLSPLPHWNGWPAHKRQAHFRREVRRIEQSFRDERERRNHRVLGPMKLAKLAHRDRPQNPPKRTKQPICHSSTLDGAASYKERFQSFLAQYYTASECWIQGNYHVEFPEGSFKPPYPRAQT